MLKQLELKGNTVNDAPDMEWIERNHGTQILQWIRANVRSLVDAEDIRQDGYIRIQQSLANWKGECSLSTWIFTIIWRATQDHYRKKEIRERVQPPTPNAPPGPFEQASRREDFKLIQDELLKLSEDHRFILTLRGLNDFSYSHMAEILHIPIGTVKSRLHEALKKISERIGPLSGDTR